MLKVPNERIKNLYNKKCEKHNNECIILNELNYNIHNSNIKYLHILSAIHIDHKYFYENLPNDLEFLEVLGLNFDLINLPINLKKIFIISFQQFQIKVPFDCILEERIMNYKPLSWINEIGQNIIEFFEISIGNSVAQKIDNRLNDPYSHSGKTLDNKTKKIYELANYNI